MRGTVVPAGGRLTSLSLPGIECGSDAGSAYGRAVLNYFGSKLSVAHKYPVPRYKTIIEPFAGGAGYSLCHWEHDCRLYDINPKVVRAWQYVIRATPAEILELPLIEPGQRVSELDCCEDARLLISWCVNAAVVDPKHTLTPWGVEHAGRNASFWSEHRRVQVANVAAHIKHWVAVECSYADLADIDATWFVDPPYADAGRNYPCGSKDIDYKHLAAWCRSRRGQVIVCENEGANWLPFRPFIQNKRGATFDDGVTRRRTEVIWTNTDP
jgi:site-specific DNA-adenine methylase